MSPAPHPLEAPLAAALARRIDTAMGPRGLGAIAARSAGIATSVPTDHLPRQQVVADTVLDMRVSPAWLAELFVQVTQPHHAGELHIPAHTAPGAPHLVLYGAQRLQTWALVGLEGQG